MGLGVSEVRRAARDDVRPRGKGDDSSRRALDSPPVILGVVGVLVLGVVLRFVCRSDLWADEVRALSGVAGTLTLVPMWFIGRRLDARRHRLGRAATAAPTFLAWSTLLLF